MPITVGNFRFRGPYSRMAMLEKRPGVWAVLDGRSLPPVAVGAAEDVRAAVEGHPSRACWSGRCDRPAVAVFYSPMKPRRRRLVRELIGAYDLPCLSDGVTLPAPRFGEEGSGRLPAREEMERSSESRVA